jgi:hypothetical protein
MKKDQEMALNKKQKIAGLALVVSLLLAATIAFERYQTNLSLLGEALAREQGLHDTAKQFVAECDQRQDSVAERFDAYGAVCKQGHDDLQLTEHNMTQIQQRQAQAFSQFVSNMLGLFLLFNLISWLFYAFERLLTRWEQGLETEPHD